MDNEQLARFWDWVQENINTQQDQHPEDSHSTIDFEGPDDDTNVSCSDPEEHKLLFHELGTTMDWIIKATTGGE